jgi:hypothetical protein
MISFPSSCSVISGFSKSRGDQWQSGDTPSCARAPFAGQTTGPSSPQVRPASFQQTQSEPAQPQRKVSTVCPPAPLPCGTCPRLILGGWPTGLTARHDLTLDYGNISKPPIRTTSSTHCSTLASMPWAKCDWKLWRQKKPVDTFVVDHVEKLPAENQARAKRVRMGPADGGRGRRIWPLCCTSMGRPCSAIGYGSGESIGQTRNNVIVTMSGYNGVSLRAMSNGRIGAQSTV